MKMNRLLIMLLAVALPLSASADNKKKKQAKKPVPMVVEEAEEDARFTKMLNATQKIVIIDSVVVDVESVTRHIFPNAEEGKIMSYAQFMQAQGDAIAKFPTNSDPFQTYVYINELGNKCIFSCQNDNGQTRLYASDILGNSWSTPTELDGLGSDSGFTQLNHPFLMPDGVTLYFSGVSDDGLGGYDIYRTRYDAERGSYLKAENIGLPFNSESNDYLYVINEMNQLGYFATTRRQPEGKVCVYTFIPSETRSVYNPDIVQQEKIKSLARIDRISDTWGDGVERKKALGRMMKMSNTKAGYAVKSVDFVLNDNVTITRVSDFKNPDNADRFRELQQMQSRLQNLSEALESARNNYATAKGRERQNLQKEISYNERRVEDLQLQIRQLEKDIRNAEQLTSK